MRNNSVFMLLFLGLLLISGCSNDEHKTLSKPRTPLTQEEILAKKELSEIIVYEKVIQYFESISAQKIIDQTIPKPTFIYFGRKTCPFCRNFLPTLNNIKEKTKSHIMVLDTEDTQTDKDIKNARDMYDIKTVPSLIYLKKDNTYEKFNTTEYEKLESWLLTEQNR